MTSPVILDEPNSNLDGEGEAALTQAIAALKALGVTVVIVSHRLTLLASVDTVVTVKDGMIEKVAPREAMLRDALRPVAAKLTGAGRPVRPVSDAAQAN